MKSVNYCEHTNQNIYIYGKGAQLKTLTAGRGGLISKGLGSVSGQAAFCIKRGYQDIGYTPAEQKVVKILWIYVSRNPNFGHATWKTHQNTKNRCDLEKQGMTLFKFGLKTTVLGSFLYSKLLPGFEQSSYVIKNLKRKLWKRNAILKNLIFTHAKTTKILKTLWRTVCQTITAANG